MNKGVYAGSFDPITNGHLWMIERGAKLFNELVVAVGTNPDKKGHFSVVERLDMLKKSVRAFPNVTVDSYENKYLVRYASSIGAQFILRGLRTEGDYEFERGFRHINSDLDSDITVIALMPPRELSEVSSSLVRGLVGYEGWEEVVEKYVPRAVFNRFLVKFNGLQKRWNSTWEKIGANGSPQETYDKLAQLYGDIQRAYHNFVHLAHVLREFDGARDLVQNAGQVEMALWYHDAVYDAHAADNEEKSAELAEQTLGDAEVDIRFIDGVRKLVLATKHDGIPGDNDSRYIADIDLAILGRPQEEFDEYEMDIRDEYHWVPEDQFGAARSAVLKRFLGRDAIYLTDFFKEKYEAQARKNIERSLAQLSK